MKVSLSQKKKRESGKVYIIGAGPGDPALLTIRAVDILRFCDVVLYDRLIDKATLQHTKKDATLISVGKQPGKDSEEKRQKRICQLIVDYALSGFSVARLKGGDPFIFGRGGEEILALSEAQIPFEYVPGVSSFYAAPGATGIPVTHRSLSGSFGVFTAHTADSEEKVSNQKTTSIDWETAAKLQTSIFLMGVRNLPDIVRELTKYGRKPQTPVAVISCATLYQQKTVTGNLSNIIKRSEGLKSPATVIVGNVVEIHTKVAPFISSYKNKQ